MNKPIHKLGTKAKILLTSVFGPYAQDDEFGSREINPMELYQNQVTRTQGVFSLRMFHRSFGLMMIQKNLDAPTTLLDFPTLTRFIDELKNKTYDIIGISGIIPNIVKVKKMCDLIRLHQPDATIVVGGHVASMEDLDKRIDADHIVRGEGIRWFRRFLGQDENAPIKHIETESGFKARVMGVNLREEPGDTAAILIPSVGCPLGCNFCSTSALFGGKGKAIHFFETGDDLFKIMSHLEDKLKVRSFFTMDENFLFNKKRALRLLELMKEHGKSWALYIFSSANVLRMYTMEQLLGLGVSWVWMGLEGKNSQYSKTKNIDTKELVEELQGNGIRVLGSTIIGLENHTPENVGEAIDYAVSHNTVFHQFMLYTANYGTPLFHELKAKGVMKSEEEISIPDRHGQFRFNYNHPHIKDGQEEQILVDAFNRDHEINGPSILRLIRTTLNGYMRHKNHADPRVRERIRWEARELFTTYPGVVWAIKRWFRGNSAVRKITNEILADLYKETGVKGRLSAPVVGATLIGAMALERYRLSNGMRYEPHTFYEKNAAARRLDDCLKSAQESEKEVLYPAQMTYEPAS